MVVDLVALAVGESVAARVVSMLTMSRASPAAGVPTAGPPRGLLGSGEFARLDRVGQPLADRLDTGHVLDEVRQDLRIGLGVEPVAATRELGADELFFELGFTDDGRTLDGQLALLKQLRGM